MSQERTASGGLSSEPVSYRDGEAELQGLLVRDPSAKGRRPGVLVAHDFWGLGPVARRRAEMLARLGYVAFALDMYGKGRVAKDRQEASSYAKPLSNDRVFMRHRALAGLEVLRKLSSVDPDRLAGIGYCFGGAVVLELARAGADLAGVVTFHGALDTPRPQETRRLKTKILVLHGAEDFLINPQIPAFQQEMRRAEADWQMVLYGGAYHGFSKKEAGNDPSEGIAYNEAADRRSWEAMSSFLAEVLA